MRRRKKTLFNFLRKPDILNKGIFQEWYNQVEGTSFDVVSAANAFYRMVHQQEGLDLLMNVRSMEPITEQLPAGKAVTGIRFVLEDGSTKDIQSGTVIDATQDADIAAAAGAPFTMGREDIGDSKSLMVATLVFKLDGVTQEVWEEMGRHNDAKIDRMSIWGYHEAREYKPTDPAKVKMRSLNIGRQNDGSVLINSMQLFDINPLDPESVRRGIETGQHEAPLIVDFF